MAISSTTRKGFDVYLTNIPFETIDMMADAMEQYLEHFGGYEIPAEYREIRDYLRNLTME